MFKGSFVALITPMTSEGRIDEDALHRLLHWHIDSGTHGIVPVGTTGEASTLTKAEHRAVLKLVVDTVNGRIPVIAGCGSNNSAEALDLHKYANEIGATAALHVTGYYNRPSQEGIFQHFEQLARSTELPIVVYNIPSRAVVDIEPETMARLSALDTVVGVKDATNQLSRPYLERIAMNQRFCQLSGEDATTVAYNVSGGMGCISVTANVAPTLCSQMQQACLDKDFVTAMSIQESLAPLHAALFREPSPSGIKYACSRLNLCEDAVRLPMVELSRESKIAVDKAMEPLNLQ